MGSVVIDSVASVAPGTPVELVKKVDASVGDTFLYKNYTLHGFYI